MTRPAEFDELNEDERAMVELVRDFVNREVRPTARELEHANTYPDKLIEQMKQLGIFGLAIPEPWGDAQVSASCYARITEELARGWMSLAGAMGGHTVVAKLLLAFGTQEQQDAYLPRMATGELRATMALCSAGAPTFRAYRTQLVSPALQSAPALQRQPAVAVRERQVRRERGPFVPGEDEFFLQASQSRLMMERRPEAS